MVKITKRTHFSSGQKGLAQGPEATGVSLLIGRKKNANLALYPLFHLGENRGGRAVAGTVSATFG